MPESYDLKTLRDQANVKANESFAADQAVSLLTFFNESPEFNGFRPLVTAEGTRVIVSLTNRQAKSLRKLLGIKVELEDG